MYDRNILIRDLFQGRGSFNQARFITFEGQELVIDCPHVNLQSMEFSWGTIEMDSLCGHRMHNGTDVSVELDFNSERCYLIGKKQTKKKDKNMLDEFVINEVELNEVDEVLLEAFFKDFDTDEFKLYTKGEKSYIIKKGYNKPVALNGEEFSALITNYLKDKRVSELTNNSINELIKSLGLIKAIKLKSPELDLGDLL